MFIKCECEFLCGHLVCLCKCLHFANKSYLTWLDYTSCFWWRENIDSLNKMWLFTVFEKIIITEIHQNWIHLQSFGWKMPLFIHVGRSFTGSDGMMKKNLSSRSPQLVFFFPSTRKKTKTIRCFVFVAATETNLSSSPSKLSAGTWEQVTGDSRGLIPPPLVSEAGSA